MTGEQHNRASKTVADSRFSLSKWMMPQDANILGNVHGGVIMKLVDEAGGLVAMRHAGKPVVTLSMDTMMFMSPILVGDIVTCNAFLTSVGRTSMEARVEVMAENPMMGNTHMTNAAFLVYVALDEHGKPSLVPELIASSDTERRLAEGAKARQAFRKQQREQEDSST